MSNKDLELLLNRIKVATKLNQEEIADKMNYSRAHFSVMKKDSPDELISLLEITFEKELQNSVVQGESATEKAILFALKTLIDEVAEIKAKVDNTKDIDKIKQEMRRKANLKFD